MDDEKKKVLIVEDDEEMRSLLKDFLEEEGFEIDCVGNGSEALRLLVRKFFDIVITDLRMAGLTGLEIIPGIRMLHPQTPVIVITAFGNEELHQRALERGAIFYLEKPIRFNILKSKINEALSKRKKG